MSGLQERDLVGEREMGEGGRERGGREEERGKGRRRVSGK